MADEEQTREQLISKMAAMRQRLEVLETRQRQYEHALRDSQLQLQQSQKMETLGTLVAGVAHEINNPINLIMYNIAQSYIGFSKIGFYGYGLVEIIKGFFCLTFH